MFCILNHYQLRTKLMVHRLSVCHNEEFIPQIKLTDIIIQSQYFPLRVTVHILNVSDKLFVCCLTAHQH